MPFPSPGSLPDPAMEPVSPALAGGFFTAEPPVKLGRTGAVIANLQIKALGLWRVHQHAQGWKPSRQPRQDAKSGLSGCRAQAHHWGQQTTAWGSNLDPSVCFVFNLFIF